MTAFITLLAVFIAQTVALIVPPWITIRRLLPGHPFAIRLFWAANLGMASQALLGFVWGWLRLRHAPLEVAFWLLLWLAVSFGLSRRRHHHPVTPSTVLSAGQSRLLFGILGGAWLLRVIHPLQTWALGQSDAYSHLQFIQNIIQHGYLVNPVYPPGHAWVMALPGLIFHLDPYVIARFGGAVFGVLLTLGVFVLTFRLTRSAVAALAAAFLAGCCPAFNLLYKTSIGVFANQLGLCLIPALLTLYFEWVQSGFRSAKTAAFLSLGIATMAVTTPIMLLHLLLLATVDGLLGLWGASRATMAFLGRMLLILLPAALAILLHVTHVAHRNSASLDQVRYILAPAKAPTGSVMPAVRQWTPEIPPPVPAPAASLVAADFFSVKRVGFQDKAMDAATLALGLAFVALLLHGLGTASQAHRLLGLWGALTALQLLQFSCYQREGWSLMLATTVLGGGGIGIFWDRSGSRRPLRLGLTLATIIAFTLALTHPPKHVLFASSAECDIVQWAKIITGHNPNRSFWPATRPPSGSISAWLSELPVSPPPTLVTRRLAGFSSKQGELAVAIGQQWPVMTFDVTRSLSAQFMGSTAYVVLLEKPPPAETAGTTTDVTMSRIHAGMTATYTRVRKGEADAVAAFDAFLADDAPRRWRVSRRPLTPHLVDPAEHSRISWRCPPRMEPGCPE